MCALFSQENLRAGAVKGLIIEDQSNSTHVKRCWNSEKLFTSHQKALVLRTDCFSRHLAKEELSTVLLTMSPI